jgi:hypothetical protein
MTSIQDGNDTRCRYVFICGLHRSGTSVLGRNVARLENCTGFKALAFRQVGLFFKQGFGLTEKVQYEIGRGSYVFGALFCSGADVYAAM